MNFTTSVLLLEALEAYYRYSIAVPRMYVYADRGEHVRDNIIRFAMATGGRCCYCRLPRNVYRTLIRVRKASFVFFANTPSDIAATTAETEDRMTADDDESGTRAERGRQPGKARDMFAAAENVLPVPFAGGLVNVLLGETDAWPTAVTRPRCRVPAACRWSAASMFTWNSGGLKPGGLWLSAAHTVSVSPHGGRASAMADVNPRTGHWGFEVAGTFRGDRLDVSASGQLCAWRRPVTARLDVDYKLSGTSVSLSADPVLKRYSVQCLQAVTDRLSMGCELNHSERNCGGVRHGKRLAVAVASAVASASVLAKYAGPDYLVSGALNAATKTAKLAYYHHASEWLQAAAIIDVDAVRSKTVGRMAFRVLSDTSVFRAAVDTHGVLSCVWDKRQNERMSVSGSVSLNAFNDKLLGIGIGLSFG